MAKTEEENQMQVSENTISFPVIDHAVRVDKKTRRITMLTKAFLSPAEIEERIAQEAASDKIAS